MFGVFLSQLNVVANCQIGHHFTEIRKFQGLMKGSHDSAAVVRPAVWKNDHQPDDVCCRVAALHFIAVLWLDSCHFLSQLCPSL